MLHLLGRNRLTVNWGVRGEPQQALLEKHLEQRRAHSLGGNQYKQGEECIYALTTERECSYRSHSARYELHGAISEVIAL